MASVRRGRRPCFCRRRTTAEALWLFVAACQPADVEFIGGDPPFSQCEEGADDSRCVPAMPLSLRTIPAPVGEGDSVAVLALSGALAIIESSEDRVLRSFIDQVGFHPVQTTDHLIDCARANGSRTIVYSGRQVVGYTRTWAPQPDGSWLGSGEFLVRVMAPQCVTLDSDAAADLVGPWTLDSVVRIFPGADDFRTSIDLPMTPPPEELGNPPFSSAAGDLDGDGIPELVVVSEEEPVLHMFHGLSGVAANVAVWDTDLSHLGDVAITLTPTGRILAVGDAAAGGSGVLVDWAIDPETRQPLADTSYTTVASANRIVVVDLDHDSDDDIVVASVPGNELWLHRSGPDGALEPGEVAVLDHTSIDIALADLDGDGEVDLVTLPLGEDRLFVAWGDGRGGIPGE